MREQRLATPRLTAWTVSDGHNQYGRFSDRGDAELEATSRRAVGASSLDVFEVWLNPGERVVGAAVCEGCERRLPHLDNIVVSSSASIICGDCSVEKYGLWCEEPTIVQCWPVADGYVNEDGEYQLFHEILTQERRAFDFRCKDTLVDACGGATPSSVCIRGDLGAVRLFLSTELAVEIGVRLKDALVASWMTDFKKWVEWGLPEAYRRPPRWPTFEANFESSEDPVTIKSDTREGRVELEIESQKTLVALRLDPAVTFKIWKTLCPTSA